MDYLIMVILGVWIVGGFINNVTGMGASILPLPVLSYLLPIESVIAICCICSACLSIYFSIGFFRYCNMRAMWSMLIGSLPGSLLGLYIFIIVPKVILQVVIGLILLAYAAWQFFSNMKGNNPENIFLAGVSGFFSALAGMTTSLGGPPLGAYAVYVSWDRKTTIATLNVFYIFSSIITIFGQFTTGIYTNDLIVYSLFSLLGLGIGILLSLPSIKWINPFVFKHILIYFIAFSGLLCIISV